MYVTVPGGQPGIHLDELLTRRWLVRTKSIWIITLAPTRDRSVAKADSDAKKVDLTYVAEQLGYIALPLGGITSKHSPKPAMVLVVVTKFDLFSDHDASNPSSAQALQYLERTFSAHIKRVQDACAQRDLQFHVEFCSAWEGWRVEALLRHIKHSLFS